MNTQRLKVISPLPIAVPRGALWAGRAAARMLGAVWRALEDHGRRKAAREIEAVARQREAGDPALARALRESVRNAAADAAEVRAMADRYRRTDPGFASELYAAAFRHEADASTAR